MRKVPSSAALLAAAALVSSLSATPAHAQPQSFTYQGELRDGSNLAQGSHDLRFEILDEGERVLQVLCADDVPVTDGRFTVLLDPGEEFAGLLRDARTIRVLVRPDTGLACDNDADFVALSPTQPFTRSPLATRAAVADRADSASSLSGFTPSYFTNAANLTGTVPDAALSTNVPRLDTGNLFTGNNLFFGTTSFSTISTPNVLFPGLGGGLRMTQNGGAITTISGAASNFATAGAIGSAIAGGSGNSITDSPNSFIGGGTNSSIISTTLLPTSNAVIAGGAANSASGFASTIGGGLLNTSTQEGATVAGGHRNQARARFATIAGGGPSDPTDLDNTNNRVHDAFGTISGGGNNRAGDNLGSADDRPFATVGGGRDNRASSEFSTVGGGSGNRAQTQFATVGGGVNNTAGGGGFSTVAGGSENDATGFVATVAGGDFNNASGERAAIGGGNGNAASARLSSVAGGLANIASGEAAAIGGGASNLAAAAYATVPGGANNEASGFASLAAGWGARAVHDGAMVFADASQSGSPLLSTGPNQLTMRASGGMRLLGAGNAPRLTIDTAGTVTVPGTLSAGTLSAGSVAYAAPVTRFRAYPAGSFVVGTLGANEIPRRTGVFLEQITGSGENSLHLPLDLPDGASITGLRMLYKDTDPNRWMQVWLIRTSMSTGVATLVTSATTQAFFGQNLPLEIPVAPPILVDNSESSLEIVVLPVADGTFGPIDDWNGRMQILGLRVQYRVVSPAP